MNQRLRKDLNSNFFSLVDLLNIAFQKKNKHSIVRLHRLQKKHHRYTPGLGYTSLLCINGKGWKTPVASWNTCKEILHLILPSARIPSSQKNRVIVAAGLNFIPIKNSLVPMAEPDIVDLLCMIYSMDTPIRQYKILSYSIDLYLKKLNIAIECDERGHSHYNQTKESQREKDITKELNCSWLRFNPDSTKFHLGELIAELNNIKTFLLFKRKFMSTQDIIVLDSNNRSSGTVQNANYNLITAGLPLVNSWEVIDYSSINQVYNVEVGVNDTVYWNEPGALTVVIPPGNYTLTTLIATLNPLMDAASGSTFTFVVGAETGVLTVSIAVSTFQWTFGTNTLQSANSLLGLNSVDTVLAASQVGDFLPDLGLHTHLLVRVSGDGNQHATRLNGQEYSAIIPFNENFGDPMRARKLINYQQILFFANSTSTITVTLFTEDGVALLNAPRYVLLLRRMV